MVLKKLYAKVVTGIAKPISKVVGKALGKEVKPMTSKEFLQTKVGKSLAGAADITAISLAGAGIGAAVKGAGGVKAVSQLVGKKAVETAGRVVVYTAKEPWKATKAALAITALGGIISAGALPLILKTTYKTGKTAGQVITGEKELSAETIKDVGKGVGIALGLGAVGTAVGYVGKKVLEGKEQLPQEAGGLEPIGAAPLKQGGLSAMSPITPETQEIIEGKPKQRRKTRYKARREEINQRVNVIVSQKQSAHRINKFIKSAAYA